VRWAGGAFLEVVMGDWIEALESIASTLEITGEPLSDTQKLCMGGTLAIWLEKAYREGMKDMVNRAGVE
jgi:esterase/lipase